MGTAHCRPSFLVSFVSQVALLGINDVFIGGTNRYGLDALESNSVVLERRHPLYSSFGTYRAPYDFLLLKLRTPSSVTAAKWNDDPSIPNAGDPAVVIGYGVTEWEGRISTRLMEAEVPIVDPRVCDREYSGLVHPAVEICAGDDGVDSCQG